MHPAVQASILETCRASFLETCRATKLPATEGQHHYHADGALIHAPPFEGRPQPISGRATVVAEAANGIIASECDEPRSNASPGVVSSDCQDASGSSCKMDGSPAGHHVGLNADAVVTSGGCGSAEHLSSGSSWLDAKAAAKRAWGAIARNTVQQRQR